VFEPAYLKPFASRKHQIVDCFHWRFHNLIQDNPNEVGIHKNSDSQNNLEFAVAVVVATADFVVVVVAAAVAVVVVDRPIDLYFWEQSLERIPQQKHLSLILAQIQRHRYSIEGFRVEGRVEDDD
jgi:hypothetical protein